MALGKIDHHPRGVEKNMLIFFDSPAAGVQSVVMPSKFSTEENAKDGTPLSILSPIHSRLIYRP
jgi:hypothetical protein